MEENTNKNEHCVKIGIMGHTNIGRSELIKKIILNDKKKEKLKFDYSEPVKQTDKLVLIEDLSINK